MKQKIDRISSLTIQKSIDIAINSNQIDSPTPGGNVGFWDCLHLNEQYKVTKK